MNKDQYTEKVLKSVEGIKRASTNDFLETRIMASLEDKSKSSGVLFLKPGIAGFALSCLTVLLVFNIYFALSGLKKENNSQSADINKPQHNDPINSTDLQNDFFSYTDVQY